jgi:hypothetical protein
MTSRGIRAGFATKWVEKEPPWLIPRYLKWVSAVQTLRTRGAARASYE